MQVKWPQLYLIFALIGAFARADLKGPEEHGGSTPASAELACIKRAEKLLTEVRFGLERIGKQDSADVQVLIDSLANPLARFDKPTAEQVAEARLAVDRPVVLSAENGDSPLLALRINYSAYPGTVSKALLQDYFKVMDAMPGVELWVVYKESETAQLEKIVARQPVALRKRIKFIEHYGPVDLWAQDGSKPTENGRETLLPLGGTRVTRANYYDMARAIERVGAARVLQSEVYFEGGNVIVGSKHIFIGTDIIRRNMEAFHKTRSETLALLEAQFGKPVIEIGYPNSSGGLSQISFHIDLNMSLARNHKTGEEVAIVESPKALLEQLLGAPALREMTDAEFSAFLEGVIKNRAVLNTKGLSRALNSQEIDFIKLCVDMGLERLRLTDLRYDFYAKLIESHGYKVLRIPGLTDILHHNAGRQFIFGHSNVILSGKNAILPQTGVRFIDEAGKAFFADLGYDVSMATAAKHSFCKQGGSRCLTETYRRSKEPSKSRARP